MDRRVGKTDGFIFWLKVRKFVGFGQRIIYFPAKCADFYKIWPKNNHLFQNNSYLCRSIDNTIRQYEYRKLVWKF